MATDKKQFLVLILLIVLSGLAYLYFGYALDRADFYELFGIYSLLFGFFIWMSFRYKKNIKWLVVSSILFRALLLFSIPKLSQDFYRFIWDGRLILEGINPYLLTPDTIISEGKIILQQSKELYDGMGHLSAGNHTNYPPLNQFCFVLAGLLGGKSILGSVVVMRLIIIAADLGTLFFGRKLLKALNLNANTIFLYLLNPFVILELTGNLHFEGVMLFFIAWSLYLLKKGDWKKAAVILGLSVSVKLIPMIFLPLMLQKLRFKSFGFYGLTGLTAAVTFIPFLSAEFVNNFLETTGLWFQKFEFNASLYYIAREIGFTYRGFNEIEIIGSYIPYVVLVVILVLSLLRNNRSTLALLSVMVLGLAIYFFLSTTVHPWYIATLLGLSVFTPYRFPLVWSFTIMLSYWAYSNTAYAENMLLIGIEYAVVMMALIWDITRINGRKLKPIDSTVTPEV
ncbi:MAG: DUF2029 domain-containing protein [Bacteroidia bacterium]|nr:DUF2029 domain-containing protein [Bacteroidia bacterium]